MDPLYKEIMYLIKYYSEYFGYLGYQTYDYLKNVNLKKINEDYFLIFKSKYKMRYYNYFIFKVINSYIIIIIKNEHKNIDKIKEIEEYFKLLLIKILTNNYGNIKFDITLSLIYYSDSFYSIMEYLEANGIIYELDRINPKKIDFYKQWPNKIKTANYLYDKLIRYDKTDLHWAWLGAVIRANE